MESYISLRNKDKDIKITGLSVHNVDYEKAKTTEELLSVFAGKIIDGAIKAFESFGITKDSPFKKGVSYSDARLKILAGSTAIILKLAFHRVAGAFNSSQVLSTITDNFDLFLAEQVRARLYLAEKDIEQFPDIMSDMITKFTSNKSVEQIDFFRLAWDIHDKYIQLPPKQNLSCRWNKDISRVFDTINLFPSISGSLDAIGFIKRYRELAAIEGHFEPSLFSEELWESAG